MNDKPVSPAYQNSDIRITTTGIDTVLIIPKIHAKITFSGLIFSIYLPYSEFGNNTEGQCGEFCIYSRSILCVPDTHNLVLIQQWFSRKTAVLCVMVLLMMRVSIGTCNNNGTDDCMLPNGKIDPSCPNMAHKWRANNNYCEYPVQPTPTPMPNPCNTTTCEVMKSRYSMRKRNE